MKYRYNKKSYHDRFFNLQSLHIRAYFIQVINLMSTAISLLAN